jgi:ectoine hydroxylase-related dioxygenase (phytanoyl-CoA dioxygenase family)
MLNALFCLDPFTAQNGGTYVVPASHKVADFPSDAAITSCQISAPEGSFIIMDSMVFHRGGVNATDRPRRAVNPAYSIPFIRQQIDLPAALGPGIRRILWSVSFWAVMSRHRRASPLVMKAGERNAHPRNADHRYRLMPPSARRRRIDMVAHHDRKLPQTVILQ